MQLSKPVMDGELIIKGLDAETQILRDKEGIPHIYSKTRKDMYFSLGFVMASDRLFQYDIIRRAGSGTLSEVIGDKTKNVDILFRTLGADIHFKNKHLSLPQEVQDDLNAFSRGLNYYASHYPLPIEFKILGYQPKPFTIMDAYYVYTYMAYSFSPMLKEDLLHSQISQTIKNRRLELLTSNAIDDEMKYVQKSSWDIDGAISRAFAIDDVLGYLAPMEGSNAWMISGDKTKSGKPILSSDPHISFSLPNIWYEAHLNCEEDNYEMYGHFLPLIPYPALGHNRDYGWGLTMSYTDDLDLFQEEIENEKFMHAGVLKDVKTFKEIIKIKGEEDYLYNLKWTRGPIVDEVLKTKNVAMKWAFFHPENQPIMTFYKISRNVNSLDDFKEGVKLGKSPGLNILYGDKKGNIAQFVYGTFFQRSNAKSSHVVGDARDFITGEYAFKLKHHRINPEDGVLISTNDRPDESRVMLKGLWYPKNRHDSVEHLLNLKEKWTQEMMTDVQTSNLDIFAKSFSGIMVQDISSFELTENEHKILHYLKRWNHLSDVQSIGATIYHKINYTLFQEILDEMPKEMLDKYVLSTGSWYFLQRLLNLPDDLWWDKVTTKEKVEKRRDILILAYRRAINLLQTELGKDPSKWQWGKIHTISFPHPLGLSKVLGKFFNLGPYPIGGAINVINHNRRKGYLDGHAVKSGPSTRRIVDFARPENSLGILPLGNSGHQLSPFFDNQRQRFIDGEYRYQLLNKIDIEDELYSTLILKSPKL